MKSGFQSGLHECLICKQLHSIITCNFITQYYTECPETWFSVEIINNFLFIMNTYAFIIKLEVILFY